MKSKRKLLTFTTLCLSVLLSATMLAKPSTAIPEAKKGRDWWMPRHEEKLAQAKTDNPQLVMIGDSITHNWEKQKHYAEAFEPYHTLNLGFGGDRTQNVLWRLQHGAVDGISPKLVTLMIGTNNSSRDSAEDIAAGIKAIVAELRQRLPETKIVVFSVFPRNNPRTQGDGQRVQAINQLLPALADGKHVQHVDINQIFLDEGGKLRADMYGRDLLHLSSKGYEAWLGELKPILANAGLNAQPVKDAAVPVAEAPVIRLWPIEMVGGEKNRLKEVYRKRPNGAQQLCGVLDPNMTVYPAKGGKQSPAVVYCPGGAYKVLGMPSAADIKKWNELGITLFVLKYRIPDVPDAAFKDIQRAVRLVRHQAKRWNVDPNKIGIFGNSAGGHLSARLSQNFDQQVYPPIDAADTMSCEPNFAVLMCAAYFQGIKMDQEFDATLFPMEKKVCSTFLTYSKDDKFCKGGEEYAKRLKAAGGSIQLKLFEKGGHGMRGCDWFSDAAAWLKQRKKID